MKEELATAAHPNDPTIKFAVELSESIGDQTHNWGSFIRLPLIGLVIDANEGQGIPNDSSVSNILLNTQANFGEKSGWKKWSTVYCGYDSKREAWRSFLMERIDMDEFNGRIGGLHSFGVSHDLSPRFDSDRFDLALQYLLALEHVSTKIQRNQNTGYDWL